MSDAADWADELPAPDWRSDDGSVLAYNRDCRGLMALLPDGLVDAVITSPPYNRGLRLAGGGFGKNGLSTRLTNAYASYSDDMPQADYEAWQADFLRDCWRVVDPERGAIFYNHKPRIAHRTWRSPLDWNPALPIRQVVTLDFSGGINFAPTHYKPQCEWLILFARAGFRLRDKSASGCGDLWRMPYDRANDHPAPFPVAMPARIFSTTRIDLALDPFGGSMTTAVAAVEAGRRCVTCELDPGYFAAGCARVAAAVVAKQQLSAA